MSDPNLLRRRRSALYVPASNPRALDKACTLPCDVVILDLEDAVAPDAKPAARTNAVRALQDGGFGARERVVRVNGLDTPWGEADLRALEELVGAAAPDAVLAPKVRDAADVARYDAALAHVPSGVRLWAMVETCRAVLNLGAIAAQATDTRLSALVVGGNDLLAEMGARATADRAPLWSALSATVVAARAFGLAALDGVCNALDDDDAVLREAAQARAFGFDGKTLVHPRQIAPCHAGFRPTAQEAEWARAVLAAFKGEAGGGVLRVGGQMVEPLHLAQAQRILRDHP